MSTSIQRAVGRRYAKLLENIGFTAEDVESLWGIKADTTRGIVGGELSLLEMAPVLLRITDVSGCGRNYFSENLVIHEPCHANDRNETAEIVSLAEYRHKKKPGSAGGQE